MHCGGWTFCTRPLARSAVHVFVQGSLVTGALDHATGFQLVGSASTGSTVCSIGSAGSQRELEQLGHSRRGHSATMWLLQQLLHNAMDRSN